MHPCSRQSTWRIIAVLALSLLPIWQSLGDHPLRSQTEARYAIVSNNMAHGSSGWLIPQYRDQAHLTKPPLTYWAQAACLKTLGHSELAVRLPGALVSSITLLGVFALGRRLGGTRHGLIAAGLLGVQPLFVVISRMPATDPWLALAWLGVSACACALWARWDHPGRWVVGFWASVALGLMAKGHLIFLPVGIVALWFCLSGRAKLLAKLRPWYGLPLAAVPLAIWVALVLKQYPEAIDLWRHETLDRAAGSGDHTEAWWYFLPVFLVGLFPANTMLAPWQAGQTIQSTWTDARDRAHPIRQSIQALHNSPNALWGLMIGVSLLVFSLNAGKRINYLLPLAPIVALLGANTISLWLDKHHNASETTMSWRRWLLYSPAAWVALACLGIAVAGPVVFADKLSDPFLIWLVPLVPIGLALLWACGLWRSPKTRQRALIVGLLALCAGWMWGGQLENKIATPRSGRQLFAAVRELTGNRAPVIQTVGFSDYSIAFYTGQSTDYIDPCLPGSQWSQISDADKRQLVYVVEPKAWEKLTAKAPWGQILEQRFERVAVWPDPAEEPDNPSSAWWFFIVRR